MILKASLSFPADYKCCSKDEISSVGSRGTATLLVRSLIIQGNFQEVTGRFEVVVTTESGVAFLTDYLLDRHGVSS